MSGITECGRAVSQLSRGLSFLGIKVTLAPTPTPTPPLAGDGDHSRGAAGRRSLIRGGRRRPDTSIGGQTSTHDYLPQPSAWCPEPSASVMMGTAGRRVHTRTPFGFLSGDSDNSMPLSPDNPMPLSLASPGLTQVRCLVGAAL